MISLKNSFFFITRSRNSSSPIDLARLHGNDLKLIQNNLRLINRGDIILFSVMRNESYRLNFFIDYYRKLGVNHFIFVDNGSSDNFNEIVSEQKDITTFYTESSYKNSNYGMHWCNDLLRRYGSGHWCLTCDPDEFFVYPFIDSRGLHELTAFLDSINQFSFFSILIDMYSDRTISENLYQNGVNPLDTCGYFDGTGYSKSFDSTYENYFIQGGVRQRIFYQNEPASAPALNKIPLIKWQNNFTYIQSMHMATPNFLNKCLSKNKPSGALLHFKFLSQLDYKVRQEMIERQHWNNSSEYLKYNNALKSRNIFYDPTISIHYKDWQTLAKFGLINIGEW